MEHPKTTLMSSSTETRSVVVISFNIQVEVVDRTKNEIHQATVGLSPGSAPSTATLFAVGTPAFQRWVPQPQETRS